MICHAREPLPVLFACVERLSLQRSAGDQAEETMFKRVAQAYKAADSTRIHEASTSS